MPLEVLGCWETVDLGSWALCITMSFVPGKTRRLHISFLKWAVHTVIQDPREGSGEERVIRRREVQSKKEWVLPFLDLET